jgi:hypothetical protein
MNQQDLNNAIKEGIALKQQANKLIDEANLKSAEEIANFKKTNEAYKEIVSRLKEVNTEVKEARDTQKELIGQYVQQESRLKGLTGLQASLSELESKRIQKMANMGKLDENRRKTFDTIASLQNDLLNTSAEDVIAQADINRQLDQQYKDLEGVRGVHAHIAKNLRQQRQIAEGVASLTEKQQKFLSNQLAVYEGIKDTIGGVLETAELLTSNLSGMFGSALIGAGFFADKLGEVTKQLGGMRDIGTTALSFIDENAVENAKALSNEFGGMNNVTLELQASTSLIASNMGISGVEASSLLGTFSRLNGNSTDVAKDLMVSTQEFAKQNGIIPSELMGELASNTEAFAIYGKDGGKNIIQAAGYAKKLGVEFNKLVGIADSLLDFESSITKELELGAMLGKNINLDRARALAFEGKIEEAAKETLNSLGGIEAFNKMDPIAKRATADLLGLQVSEFEKMVNNQKEADTLSGQLNEKFSLLSEGTSYIANEWGGGILKAFGSGIIAVGQMGAGFSTMGINLGGVIKGTAQVLKNLLGMVAGPVLNGLKMAGTFLANTGIGKAVGGLKDRLMEGVTNRITTPPPTPTIPDTANPASRGGIMDSLSKIKMSDVLKGAAAMLIVAAAVFVLGKAMQEYADVGINNILAAAGSILVLGLAMAGLGLLMSSGVGAVAILAGAAALLIVAASVLVLGKALQAIGTGFEMLSNGVSTLVPNLISVGSTIASLVTFIPAIGLLSLALMGLAASLTALGLAGILAAPGLMALSAVGTVATGLGSVLGLGGGEGEGGQTDNMKILVDEIRGLREDLKSGKIGVYMDGTAVASKVSRVVDRIGVNSYS